MVDHDNACMQLAQGLLIDMAKTLLIDMATDNTMDNPVREKQMLKRSVITPEAIQRFRRANGLSQQDLASILGVGVATVSRWETAQAKVTGTAAVILQTVIAGSHAEPTAELSLKSGRAIYQLLKSVFAPADGASATSMRESRVARKESSHAVEDDVMAESDG